MKNILGLFLSIVCCGIVFNGGEAVATTVESLFRNGHNSDISKNFISVSFSIEETTMEGDKELNMQDLPREVSSADQFGGLSKKETIPYRNYFKMIFYIEDENRVHFIQSEYKKSKMNLNSIDKIFYHSNFMSLFDINNLHKEREIFYSLFSTLILNSHVKISKFLAKNSRDFQSNKQLQNVEKLNLLKRYQYYLKQKKSDSTNRRTLESPLRPKENDRKERVNKILNESLYFSSKNISLFRENNSFYLRVDLDKVMAMFTNEEHRLVKFSYSNIEGKFQMFFNDYILFNGIHELPKYIFIKTQKGRTFKIRTLALSHLNLSLIKLSKIIENMRKYSNKSQSSKEGKGDIPSFMIF